MPCSRTMEYFSSDVKANLTLKNPCRRFVPRFQNILKGLADHGFSNLPISVNILEEKAILKRSYDSYCLYIKSRFQPWTSRNPEEKEDSASAGRWCNMRISHPSPSMNQNVVELMVFNTRNPNYDFEKLQHLICHIH